MLYKLTVKNNQFTNGVRLEKGMSVEVAFQSSNLLGNAQGCELVQNAFMAKYGVDMMEEKVKDLITFDAILNN